MDLFGSFDKSFTNFYCNGSFSFCLKRKILLPMTCIITKYSRIILQIYQASQHTFKFIFCVEDSCSLKLRCRLTFTDTNFVNNRMILKFFLKVCDVTIICSFTVSGSVCLKNRKTFTILITLI